MTPSGNSATITTAAITNSRERAVKDSANAQMPAARPPGTTAIAA